MSDVADTLTHDQAHQLLMADELPQEATPVAPAAVAQPEAEEVAEPVEGEAEPVADEAAEEEQAEEAEAETVAAPDKWDAEDKAWFAELPPEQQEKILKQEAKREAVLTKAREKASSEARQAVEGELSQVKAVAESLKEFLPKAVAAFHQEYGEPDWTATLDQYGADATMKMQIEYNERKAHLIKLDQAAQEANALAQKQYVAEEGRKLAELAPELASDTARQKEVATYLLSKGAKPEDLDNIPAWAAVVAYEAHQFNKAKAEAVAPKPKPIVKPGLKPAAAQAATPSQRTEAQLRNRLAQTGDRDTAHALLIKLGI